MMEEREGEERKQLKMLLFGLAEMMSPPEATEYIFEAFKAFKRHFF